MQGRMLLLDTTSISRYMALSEVVQQYASDKNPVTVFVSSGWAQTGLSIGKSQPTRYVNREACRQDGIDVVRRSTEGYVVFHGKDDVTYGIAVPRNFAKSKRGFDDKVFPVLVRSLERVNVPNGYDPFPDRYGNVFVNGRKISGSAQNTGNRRIWLQHGIIAVGRHDAEDFAKYVISEKKSSELSSQMTSVEQEGGIADPLLLRDVLAEEFSRHLFELGIELRESDLSDTEKGLVENLTKKKYENGDWLESGDRRRDESGRVACFTGYQTPLVSV